MIPADVQGNRYDLHGELAPSLLNRMLTVRQKYEQLAR